MSETLIVNYLIKGREDERRRISSKAKDLMEKATWNMRNNSLKNIKMN